MPKLTENPPIGHPMYSTDQGLYAKFVTILVREDSRFMSFRGSTTGFDANGDLVVIDAAQDEILRLRVVLP